MTLLSELLIVN